jgi:hypothetical protein
MSGELLSDLHVALTRAAEIVGKLMSKENPQLSHIPNPNWEPYIREKFAAQGTANVPIAVGVVVRKNLPSTCEKCGGNLWERVMEPAPFLDTLVYRCGNPTCEQREYVDP